MNTLTKEEIEAATPRQLDALIAEYVMGEGKDVRVKGSTERVKVYTSNPYWLSDGHHTQHDLQSVRVPAYSTTGDGMLLVLEKMREHEVSYTLGNEFYGDTRPWCYFGGSQARRAEWRIVADTLPIAVCRAALLTLIDQ